MLVAELLRFSWELTRFSRWILVSGLTRWVAAFTDAILSAQPLQVAPALVRVHSAAAQGLAQGC